MKKHKIDRRGKGPISQEEQASLLAFLRKHALPYRNRDLSMNVVPQRQHCSGGKTARFQPGDSLGGTHNGKIWEASPTRHYDRLRNKHGGKGKIKHLDLYGRHFASSEAMRAAIHAHGYGVMQNEPRESYFPSWNYRHFTEAGDPPLRRSMRRRYQVAHFNQLPAAVQDAMRRNCMVNGYANWRFKALAA